MKERDIFERTIAEPYTVLGLNLLPFSLGHLILLHRVDSAFANGKTPTYEDLSLAVFICSREYEQALIDFDDPDLPNEMQRWAEALSERGPIDLSASCKLFAEYLANSELRFESGKDYVFDEERVSVRRRMMPFVHGVRVKLQSRMHFSDKEIFNRPWALCLLDFYILADEDGLLQITDRDAVRESIAEVQAIADRLAAMRKGESVGR